MHEPSISASTAVGTVQWKASLDNVIELPVQSFVDPDPFQELFFKNALAAKRAIADYLGRALAKLTPEQMEKVNLILEKTLNKQEVMQQIKDYFKPHRGGLHAE